MTPAWLLATTLGAAAARAEPEGAPSNPSEVASTEPASSEPAEPAEPDGADARIERLEAQVTALQQQGEALRRDNEALRREGEALRRDDARRHEQQEQLEQRIRTLEQEQQYARDQIDGLLPLHSKLGGYLDVGFFWAAGNGSGVRPDIGHVVLPQYEDVVPDSWVLLGDPLSTQINARGDPADTGESRAVLLDSVDSRGKASFIANALNLDLVTGVGDHLVIEGMVDFLPRGRDVSDPDGVFLGDYVNIKLAYVNYIVPTRRVELDLYAGKLDPVFGYEYRIQESPDRISVTPSLMCRYTCGRPVGVKGRAKFLPSRALVLAASLTNGSSFREGFGLANEIDTNHFKTVASRLSYRFDVGAGLEVGASGQFGAQDLQPADDVYQWQYGLDVHLDVRGVDLAAEYVRGRAAGTTAPDDVACAVAPCLEFRGGYTLLGYHALNWLMPYARVDWRNAVHQNGASFVYVSKLVRFTPGVRFDLGTHVAIKAEYTLNRELGPIPQFRNDVVTTSPVAKI